MGLLEEEKYGHLGIGIRGISMLPTVGRDKYLLAHMICV